MESDDDDDEPDNEDNSSPPKGRDFDLNQIRSELKGFEKAVKITTSSEAANNSDSTAPDGDKAGLDAKKSELESKAEKPDKTTEKVNTDDIYEFKEPEPFEFEARATTKLGEEKGTKKRLVTRLLDDVEVAKSPPKKKGGGRSPPKDEEKKPRTFGKRTPSKAAAAKLSAEHEEDEKVKEETTTPAKADKACDDPFDKLVESPSFNLITGADKKTSPLSGDAVASKVVKALNMDEKSSAMEQTLNTIKLEEENCKGLRESYDADIAEGLFLSKEPPVEAIKVELPLFRGFNAETTEESKGGLMTKDGASDEDDLIKAAIQRAISNTMTDEDSAEDDLFMAQSAQSAQMFPSTKINTIQGTKLKDELITDSLAEPLSINTAETALAIKDEPKDSKEVKAKQISPALQETDSSLLEAISLQTEMLKKEEPREPHIKTGTKIADSILQKFNMIKKNEEVKPAVAELCSNPLKKEECKAENDEPVADAPNKIQSPATQPAADFHLETNKKRSNKKVVSREFIEESDSDSTDSEERLVIARSDDDSQTNPSADKLDFKDTDNSNSIQAAITDDSQEVAAAVAAEPTDTDKPAEDTGALETAATVKLEENVNDASLAVKSEPEESESSISLLLCKETIPGSPAPVTEMSPAPAEARAKPKSAKSLLLEMPFASAPGTSNSKGMLSSSAPEMGKQPAAPSAKEEQPLAVPLEQQIQVAEASSNGNAIEPENNGPTTPESTLSNLSPNTADNESCKSTEEKEEDALLGADPPPAPPAKKREEPGAAPCRKRRRSCKGDELPVKRGRKPNVRSLRANSDSDDTSEHSAPGTTPPANSVPQEARISISSRSPMPSKFNFIIELGMFNGWW